MAILSQIWGPYYNADSPVKPCDPNPCGSKPMNPRKMVNFGKNTVKIVKYGAITVINAEKYVNSVNICSISLILKCSQILIRIDLGHTVL